MKHLPWSLNFKKYKSYELILSCSNSSKLILKMCWYKPRNTNWEFMQLFAILTEKNLFLTFSVLKLRCLKNHTKSFPIKALHPGFLYSCWKMRLMESTFVEIMSQKSNVYVTSACVSSKNPPVKRQSIPSFSKTNKLIVVALPNGFF